jgi:large subunit ribosomal protein L11
MLVSSLNLRVIAGKASPSPAIASSLGPKGVNLMQFCKACNDASASFNQGEQIRVKINIFKDKTFKLQLCGPSSTDIIKSFLKVKKFSSSPGKDIVHYMDQADVNEICKKLLPYMNTRSHESAFKMVVGKLKSMGVQLRNSSSAQNSKIN